MGTVIKKCLACGTLNLYEAEVCKNCESPLLAEVDQEDEIRDVDPMEAAINDTVAEDNDDMVAKILREQAENAKKIVAKEKAKEERKKKRQTGSGTGGFSMTSGGGSGKGGFSLGGDSAGKSYERPSTGYGSFGRVESFSSSSSGFKINTSDYSDAQDGEPKLQIGGGSLRMQAMRQTQEKRESEKGKNS